MQIVKYAKAGLDASGDAVVEVFPAEELSITVCSTVKYMFETEIYRVIEAVVKEMGVTAAAVVIHDRAALDYVIRGRTEAALKRSSLENVQESTV